MKGYGMRMNKIFELAHTLRAMLDEEALDKTELIKIADEIIYNLNYELKKYECPLNEFSEHCTADMPSADKMIHYLMNPQKSDFPEAAKNNCIYWKSL